VEAKSPRRVKPRFQGANLPRGHQIGKLTGLHRQKDRSLKSELTKNGGKTSVIG
jgi:hypothetical protein